MKLHQFIMAQEKAVHLINCKALFTDPNGAHARNMALRRVYNKAVKAGGSDFEIEFSGTELTHFRNGIVGGILQKGTNDRDAGHLMACADSLKISSWVEGVLPKMDEKDECNLPLDESEDVELDGESEKGHA